MSTFARKIWRVFVLCLAVAVFLAVWAFYIEPSSLRVKTYRVDLPHWSSQLSGMRVAVLADLHVGAPHIGLDKLETIVNTVNSVKPDLIIIPGDMVITGVLGGTFIPPEKFAPILAKLKAPLGVWAVLGNHDWWYDAEKTHAALEKEGISLLEDRSVKLVYKSTPFWLAGVSDATEGQHDVNAALRDVPADAPVLVMTHHPDIFPEIPTRVSLTIAGHTHGGQVYVPLLGRPIIPSKYGQRYAAGHIIESNKHLFVSTGIGTSILPVRFLTPPEISLLVLHSE